MKTSCVALFAVVVALFGWQTRSVSGAECTADDFMFQSKLMSTPEFVKACGQATMAGYAFCSDEKCYEYVKSLSNELPTCTVRGVPWRKGWDDALETCKLKFGQGSAPPPAASGKNTTSAITKPSDAPVPTSTQSSAAVSRTSAMAVGAAVVLSAALG